MYICGNFRFYEYGFVKVVFKFFLDLVFFILGFVCYLEVKRILVFFGNVLIIRERKWLREGNRFF